MPATPTARSIAKSTRNALAEILIARSLGNYLRHGAGGWCVEVGTAVKDGIERSECFAGKTCRRMLAHVITPQSPPDPLHNANGQMEEVGCVYTCTCECVKGQYSKHKKDSTCQHIPQVSSLYSQDPTRHLSLSQVLVQYACREVNGQSLLLNMQSRHHSM